MINFLKTTRKRFRSQLLTPCSESQSDIEDELQNHYHKTKLPKLDIIQEQDLPAVQTAPEYSNQQSKFLCNVCQKFFSTKSNLNKHFNRFHAENKSQHSVPQKSIPIEETQKNKNGNNKQNAECTPSSIILNCNQKDQNRKQENQEFLSAITNINPFNFKKDEVEQQYLQQFRKNLEMIIPIYSLLKKQATQESIIQGMNIKSQGSFVFKECFYKIYNEKSFLQNQALQINLYNEFCITQQSKDQGLKGIIPLLKLTSEKDHIGFVYPLYEKNYGDFLKFHYNPKLAQTYLMIISSGIKELHKLGFSHKNLNPKNIVLNLNQPNLAIINFENSELHTNLIPEITPEDKLFYPNKIQMNQGDPRIDIYAFGCLILYTYICKDFYVGLNSQTELLIYAQGFLDDPNSDPRIQELIQECIFVKDFTQIKSLQTLRDFIIELDFEQILVQNPKNK